MPTFCLFFFIPLLVIQSSIADVSPCNHTIEPISWLTTVGRGIDGWATAGIEPNGPNFCLAGNRKNSTVEINYHMNISADAIPFRLRKIWHGDNNRTHNGCILKDPRIHYCFSFCEDNLEEAILTATLKYRVPYQLATEIYENYGKQKDVAVTVLDVDFNDPNAHLDVQTFLLPCWCSVYVGIDPSFGSPYLFEIQVAHLLTAD